MDFSSIFKTVTKFTSDHAPEILTGLSVAGAVQTAIFSARASYTASRVIDHYEIENGVEPDPRERFIGRTKLVWRLYIPTVISGGVTVAMIICSNRLSVKRQAVLTSALATTQTYLHRYESAVSEVLDDNLKEKVETVLGKQVSEAVPDPDDIPEDELDGETDIFQDTISGRYFRSTIGDVKDAIADCKMRIADDYYLSLNELYDKLGLERTEQGDYLGWNIDSRLEATMRPGITKGGRPCIQIHYRSYPKDGAFKIG